MMLKTASHGWNVEPKDLTEMRGRQGKDRKGELVFEERGGATGRPIGFGGVTGGPGLDIDRRSLFIFMNPLRKFLLSTLSNPIHTTAFSPQFSSRSCIPFRTYNHLRSGLSKQSLPVSTCTITLGKEAASQIRSITDGNAL